MRTEDGLRESGVRDMQQVDGAVLLGCSVTKKDGTKLKPVLLCFLSIVVRVFRVN
jgi:hypothetical protein